MRIPGADATGGQGGADTTLAHSKSKGKVVWTIRSNEEVSSDDDIPLQMQMRASGSGGSMTGRISFMGQ
jgi:hypothetical protein